MWNFLFLNFLNQNILRPNICAVVGNWRIRSIYSMTKKKRKKKRRWSTTNWSRSTSFGWNSRYFCRRRSSRSIARKYLVCVVELTDWWANKRRPLSIGRSNRKRPDPAAANLSTIFHPHPTQLNQSILDDIARIWTIELVPRTSVVDDNRQSNQRRAESIRCRLFWRFFQPTVSVVFVELSIFSARNLRYWRQDDLSSVRWPRDWTVRHFSYRFQSPEMNISMKFKFKTHQLNFVLGIVDECWRFFCESLRFSD